MGGKMGGMTTEEKVTVAEANVAELQVEIEAVQQVQEEVADQIIVSPPGFGQEGEDDASAVGDPHITTMTGEHRDLALMERPMGGKMGGKMGGMGGKMGGKMGGGSLDDRVQALEIAEAEIDLAVGMAEEEEREIDEQIIVSPPGFG